MIRVKADKSEFILFVYIHGRPKKKAKITLTTNFILANVHHERR